MKNKNYINKNVILQFAKSKVPALVTEDFVPKDGFENGFGVYISTGGVLKFKLVGDEDEDWRTIDVPDNHYPNMAFRAIASETNGTTAVVQLAGV